MNIQEHFILTAFDTHFYKLAKWQLKFVWWPTKCDQSTTYIWLAYAYKGTARHFYKQVQVEFDEVRWLTKQDFIFGKLSGKI